MDDIEKSQEAQLRDTEIAIRVQLGNARYVLSDGICEDCGETIPPERVKAINASMCIECAKLEEARMRKWIR
jgi:RNA polymerase-binding transcription factor DksA